MFKLHQPLPVIRYNIINVLSKLGVKFQEVKGGFVCMHTPSVQHSHSNELDEENKLYGDAFKSKSSDSFEAAEPEGSKTPSRQPSLQLPSHTQQRHQVLNHTNQVTLLEALVEMCQDVSFPLVMRLILTVKRMDLKL